MEMWWLTVLVEIWQLICEDVVASFGRCGDLLVDMWWLLGGFVVVYWFIYVGLFGRRGDLLVEMWWLISGDVVAS